MSKAFAWSPMLKTDAPAGAHLKAALLTTYDRPDERLLAEHILPMLLNIDHSPDGETRERKSFLVELDQRLKQLHGQIVVVSSATASEEAPLSIPEAGAYEWIWRSVRHLTVGGAGKATQHAKLWLLHWGSTGSAPEHIEIVVSSTNLTTSAFKGQIQAVWRACIPMEDHSSATRLKSWGILSPFIDELAKSTRNESILDFKTVLGRATCPAGITFVASVPGAHSRKTLQTTPWGSAGLRTIAPSGRGGVRTAVMAPYVGSWSQGSLSSWLANIRSKTKDMSLVWIDQKHPWARGGRWILPENSRQTFADSSTTLLRLVPATESVENRDYFHDEHRATDTRWSHAKVYKFSRGNSRQILVTSANFSTSAWGEDDGSGGLRIENFELGVSVAQGSWPFDNLWEFTEEEVPATVDSVIREADSSISWAQAHWDGESVTVECRTSATHPVVGHICSSGNTVRIKTWSSGSEKRLLTSSTPWRGTSHLPATVVIECASAKLTVPVFDYRPEQQRATAIPNELDPDDAQSIADALLLERYGGRPSDEGGNEPPGLSDNDPPQVLDGSPDAAPEPDTTITSSGDDYGVPALMRAREHLSVVDNWWQQVKAADASTAKTELRWLHEDGKRLCTAFSRLAKTGNQNGAALEHGASLAAEEISLRLKHFPDFS